MIRRGMTIVEMLVAMAATLMLMAAVAQAFAVFGAAITGSRGVLDLDARMRGVAWQLRSDLTGITVRPLPPIAPETAQGYLEIIEGPLTDRIDAVTGDPVLDKSTAIGPTDIDDVLLFTTQSTNTPFVGRGPDRGSFESAVAEVAWFARPTPGTSNPPTFTLYRKQLLVMGYVGAAPFSVDDKNEIALPLKDASNRTIISDTAPWGDLFSYPCDVSARREGNTLVPNTLADLSRREARFLHNSTGAASLPYFFVDHLTSPPPDGLVFVPGSSSRAGEDVVLTDVIAFDVRVFDPAAPVRVPGTTALVPGEFSKGSGGADAATGAYVDIGHGVDRNSLLSGNAPRFQDSQPRPIAGTATLTRTYDTWSLAYEANGRDEDGDGDIDDSLDGLDNNNDTVVDNAAEFETRPPYAFPLRGVEVRIRCYEPASRQVRQVTVRHTFVPH